MRRSVLALAITSGAVVAGAVAALAGSRHWSYGFLLWNLVLAWVPVVLALGIRRLAASPVPTVGLVAPLALWLLFLPNAPYLVTDLSHLGEQRTPLELDGLILGLAAAGGLLAGSLSLMAIESAVRARLGARAARIALALAIPLASLGVYFGRVLRWNSWDALTEPRALLDQVLAGARDPLSHGQALAVVAGFALFLAASHGVYRRLARTPAAG
jgi:uncharacterized membrane protein